MASSTGSANVGARPATGLERVVRGVAVCVLPVLMSLYVAATTFTGGTFWPWKPIMVDLDVYRRAGSVLLAGGDFYALPGPLQFLYPPFAAVLAVPLAVLPLAVVQIGWTAAGALALLAVLHRFGLNGWPLSLIGTAVIFFVEPVVETLAFGQLGIFLVALVVLDLAPGPRVFRRLLPQGTLTAVAAAIKLTPAIFVLYLLAVGRIRAFVVAVVVGAGGDLDQRGDRATGVVRVLVTAGARRHRAGPQPDLLHEPVGDGRRGADLRPWPDSGPRRTDRLRNRCPGWRLGGRALAPDR